MGMLGTQLGEEMVQDLPYLVLLNGLPEVLVRRAAVVSDN